MSSALEKLQGFRYNRRNDKDSGQEQAILSSNETYHETGFEPVTHRKNLDPGIPASLNNDPDDIDMFLGSLDDHLFDEDQVVCNLATLDDEPQQPGVFESNESLHSQSITVLGSDVSTQAKLPNTHKDEYALNSVIQCIHD